MVRELGFMRPTLAGTDYSPSAVHTLLETELQDSVTAAQLVQLLRLDKSSVSRMVGKLIAGGELRQVASSQDARTKVLRLTAQGKRTVARIHAHGRNQVQAAMQRLDSCTQQVVAQGLGHYADALAACSEGATPPPSPTIVVTQGYRPGLVGRITEMHASFYAQHAGFGQFFESKVASGLAEFVGRLDRPGNGIWLALRDDRIVGSVAIDGEDLGHRQAHLRWFILDADCRGQGLGRQLLTQALAFCDRQAFAQTQLWTFKGLDAARSLYESLGFQLVHESPGQQWGSTVTEQQFTRRGAAHTP